LTLKQHIPWQIKIAAKILLKRFPLDYTFWRGLKLFKHGAMDSPEYAFDVFRTHFGMAGLGDRGEKVFVGLELGPGDSLFSAFIAKAFGSSKTYLVDVHAFARRDLGSYQKMARFLRSRGLPIRSFDDLRTMQEVLETCSAEYLTQGIESLRTIPTHSVSFAWSHSVLQLIRNEEFLATLKELKRIQRPNGVGTHRIDLRDCMGGSLNNLRFRTRTWESDFWAKSGFYTNRIRYSKMIELFQKAGFEVKVLDVRRWAQLPVPRHKLAIPFRCLSDEELLISGFDVSLH